MVKLNLVLVSLIREWRTFSLWVLCMSLAVTGLLVVDVFRTSLSETLRLQGRNILSADLEISSRRVLTDDELSRIAAQLPADTRSTEVFEMLAMLTHITGERIDSRLGSVKFVDDQYPLAGQLNIETQAGNIKPGTGDALGTVPSVWLAPDLATLLNLKLGEQIRIGKVDFTIAGWINKDTSQTFSFGNMAPRVYAHRKYLEQAELIQQGSTFYHSNFYAMPTSPNSTLKVDIEKNFADPAISVKVPTDLEQGSYRVLSRLMDYLGLTGLVTLCLGWAGVIYLGRRWLNLEMNSIGVLKCLGMSGREIERLLLGKLAVILGIGVVIGGTLAWIGAAVALPQVKSSMPAEFVLVWSWSNTLLLILIGPAAGVLLLLPSLRALSREHPLELVNSRTEPRPSLRDIFLFSLATLSLLGLITLLQAKSWLVSGIFLAGLLMTVTVVTLIALGLISGFNRFAENFKWKLHLTLRLWSRRSGVAILLITVTAVAGLLSQLVPHLEKSLVGELLAPPRQNRPALFMFDIQDDQLEGLNALLTREHIEVSESAPFIRARILNINGEDFERARPGEWATREQEADARFRNRGANLTYRDRLAEGDIVTHGKPWDQVSTDPDKIEFSVEERYADRLGLKLGDIVRFDIQGIELDATVANLRSVDWSRFEPNFFITFKPGVLDEAPKTWVTTIRPHSSLTPVEIQTKIATEFPSITSVNMREALENASELFSKLGAGLRVASSLCLALGVLVSFIILVFQLSSSARDWQQLRVLGLNPRELQQIQLMSYCGLALIGMTLGTALSFGVAWALARFAFSTELLVDWISTTQIFVLTQLILSLGLWLLTRRMNRRASLQQLLGGD